MKRFNLLFNEGEMIMKRILIGIAMGCVCSANAMEIELQREAGSERGIKCEEVSKSGIESIVEKNPVANTLRNHLSEQEWNMVLNMFDSNKENFSNEINHNPYGNTRTYKIFGTIGKVLGDASKIISIGFQVAAASCYGTEWFSSSEEFGTTTAGPSLAMVATSSVLCLLSFGVEYLNRYCANRGVNLRNAILAYNGIQASLNYDALRYNNIKKNEEESEK